MHMKVFATAWLIAALSSYATAQVYESTDAQGNPVFSDQPSSGAREIDVPATNSADPPADIPAPPRPAEKSASARAASAPAAAVPEQIQDDDYMYYGGADNDEARERREDARERRDERSDRPRVEHHTNAPRRSAGGAVGGGGGGRR